MTRKQFFKFFLQLVVVLTGALASWRLYFFKPYFKPHRQVTYQTESGGPGNLPPTVIAAPGPHYNLSGFGQFWLGTHNRPLWIKPVKVPVFQLQSPPHYLSILKRGGGMQTTSFTLLDKAGNSYSLRSVDKDPTLALPPFWRNTLVRDFVQDQISASDPYAFLVVAQLAQTVNVKQVIPELVFIMPGTPAFRKFGVAAGGFYNLSRKLVPPEALMLPGEQFSGVFATQEMFELMRKNPGRNAVDTAYYLRCRLFDLFISDWDRHAGQWDWLAFSGKNGTVFRPVPKDRDQAFGYYEDGALPGLLASNLGVRKITSFTPEFKDMQGFTMNGSMLDRQLFKNLKPEDFVKTARNMQAALTDEALQAALRKYPAEVYPERAPIAFKTLQARRNKLHEAALEYYQVYAEE